MMDEHLQKYLEHIETADAFKLRRRTLTRLIRILPVTAIAIIVSYENEDRCQPF